MKVLSKSSLSSRPGGFLTLLWGHMLITFFFFGIYSIISFLQPKALVIQDYPRAYRMELSPMEDREIFEIQETAPWIKEPRLRISTTLDFKAGNRWIVLYYFLGGFFILVIAAVFRIGTQLREEQSLTI